MFLTFRTIVWMTCLTATFLARLFADQPLVAQEVSRTFSIVAIDPATGQCGAAVASKYPAVGRVVPYVRADVGAFCTQHHHVPAWGEPALDSLASGKTPSDVLADLLRSDKQPEQRQLAIIDMQGRTANHNPTQAGDGSRWWGAMAGRNFCCQGNTLAGREVVVKMAEAFEATEGSLADKLMASLVAGDVAGGDHRGRLAAGIRVAKKGIDGYWFELYEDKSDDAVADLLKKYAATDHAAKGKWPGGQPPTSNATQNSADHASTIKFGRYEGCPVIQNKSTRVVFCPEVGGRILEYSLRGTNGLFVSKYDQGIEEPNDSWKSDPSAGRFDIGPEMIVPKRDELFRGKWVVEKIDELSLRMTSQKSPLTGVQLIREFQLDANSSRLRCTQRIFNVSDRVVQYCHWSRTLAAGAGIVLVALEGKPRFPKRYVRYEGAGILARPEDPGIRIRDGFLEIIGPPTTPKLGMDSFAGWVAHQQATGLLFIKQYPTFPDRLYNEVAGITLSTWAPASGETVEIEPIGPAETIAPGGQSSFTETWWLLDGEYPKNDAQVDLNALQRRFKELSIDKSPNP